MTASQPNRQRLAAFTHSFAVAGADTITVAATDPTGTYNAAATLPITVSTPTVTVTGSANAHKGGIYSLSLTSAGDPGYTPTQYGINWGDGQTTTTATLGTFTHTFATLITETVSVTLTDSTGVYKSAATLPVTVNAAPTVAISGNANANKNGLYTLNLTGFTDPGYTPSLYLITWGDGQTSSVSSLGSATHTFGTVASDTISVSLTDSTGTFVSTSPLAVKVNASPTIAFSGASHANATGLFSLTLGAVKDTGYSVSQYVVNWGDGTSNSYSAAGVVTHTYPAAGTNSISVSLTDPTGTYAAAGALSVIVNPTPTVALTGIANANVGGSYSLKVGAVTDSGFTVSNYVINWGDGQSSTYTAAPGTVAHTYATTGKANITVSLTDSSGTYSSAGKLSLTVNPSPTVAVSGGWTTGSAYALTLGAVTDPGYTVSKFTIHWGDGTTSTATAAGVVNHTFASKMNTTITVDLTDATGTYVSAGKVNVLAVATIAGRFLFYNNSPFNGNMTAATTADFAAIDTTKQAPSPGKRRVIRISRTSARELTAFLSTFPASPPATPFPRPTSPSPAETPTPPAPGPLTLPRARSSFIAAWVLAGPTASRFDSRI